MSNIAFLFLPLAFFSLPAVLPFVSPSSQVTLVSMVTSDSQKYTTVRLLTLAWVPVRAHGVDVFFEREEQEIPRTELAGMQAGFSQIDPFCVACFACTEGRDKTMSAHQVVFRCSVF